MMSCANGTLLRSRKGGLRQLTLVVTDINSDSHPNDNNTSEEVKTTAIAVLWIFCERRGGTTKQGEKNRSGGLS